MGESANEGKDKRFRESIIRQSFALVGGKGSALRRDGMEELEESETDPEASRFVRHIDVCIHVAVVCDG